MGAARICDVSLSNMVHQKVRHNVSASPAKRGN